MFKIEAMIQDIIVYIIIGAAVAYTIYSVVKSIRTKSKSPCADGYCGCDAKKEIHKMMELKQLKLADEK